MKNRIIPYNSSGTVQRLSFIYWIPAVCLITVKACEVIETGACYNAHVFIIRNQSDTKNIWCDLKFKTFKKCLFYYVYKHQSFLASSNMKSK